MGLIDHDVPVGPVPVGGGAFDEFTGVALKEAIRQVLGVGQVLGEQLLLVVHQVVVPDLEDVQYAGGVLGPGLPFPLGGLVGRLVATEHVHQFVEQRHVRHRPGGAIGAQQRRVGAGRS